MKRKFTRVLTWIGGVVFFYALFLIVVLALPRFRDRVPRKAILEVNLEKELVEAVPDDAVARVLLRDQPSVRDLVEALDRGAADERVSGLVAHIGAAPQGMAQVQEIRDAVARFRAKKKFAIAYSETFGEFQNGGRAYYLATAFEEVWLQPSGDVNLSGIMLESMFRRGTYDKLGLRFRGGQRYEYKNAFNIHVEKKFTPAHREAMESIVKSWYSQWVRGIAAARKMSEDEVRTVIDRGPFLGQEAVDAKLVDRLAYRDEVMDEAKKRAGEGAERLALVKYLERAGRPHDEGETIALIYGTGGVERGKSGFNPLNGEFTMGSDSVAAAFRAAMDDKDVKAILFRVDSPGGSYVASDTIWREVERARKAGKPVIVSMGDLAGSGGYFVAMPADKIVAQPGTITGSIGVVGGKFLTSGFWEKIGVSWDEVHAGANATMWTGTHDYSPEEWKRFEGFLDRIYADFTTKVAAGRKLPKEEVLKIAKGRIYTGEDAKAIGLVDELGGFDTALRLAKQAAKIPESEEVKLRTYPRPRTLGEVLLAFGKRDDNDVAAESPTTEAAVRALESIQPLVRRIEMMTGAEMDVLSMPVTVEP
ncbi:MAG: signal peptide peptidase SppA [Acidobacteria bacterium]|nr:signal peptide peptidase SppA [Acidobacteriota bacterium]